MYEALRPCRPVRPRSRPVGDVRVGPDKRIASLKYEWLLLWEPKPGLNRPNTPADLVVDMELSDYGTPVAVEAPTDATPAK